MARFGLVLFALLTLSLAIVWSFLPDERPHPKDVQSPIARVEREDSVAQEVVTSAPIESEKQGANRKAEAPLETKVTKLLENIEETSFSDEKGIQRLQTELRKTILQSRSQWRNLFAREYVPRLKEIPLRSSFLMIKETFSTGSADGALVDQILDLQSPEELQLDENNEMHHPAGPQHTLQILKSYTLDQLSLEIDKGKFSEAESLRDSLETLARDEPNLQLARGALKILLSLSSDRERTFEEIVHTRPPNEAFAFSDLKP